MVGVLVVLIALLVCVGGYLWLNSEADPSGPTGAQIVMSVTKGTGLDQLAGTLQQEGVIGNSLAYRIWIRLHGDPPVFPGTYAFNKHDSFATVTNLIAGGPNVFDLEVPPGFTVAELAGQVGQFPGHDASKFEALATGGSVRSPWQPPGISSLDGLLGTGTYQLLPGETDTQLLTQMIDRFDQQARAMHLSSRANALGLTPYQAITIASIAEKEGVIPKNLGPVVRVILNRLRQGIPLQMDSTVLYAEGRDGGPVTRKDEQLRTPYNTYLNKGLTPTPICFPSPAALHAALYPPAGSWLYIELVEPNGTEAFSDTFAQQLANEALAARRGLP